MALRLRVTSPLAYCPPPVTLPPPAARADGPPVRQRTTAPNRADSVDPRFIAPSLWRTCPPLRPTGPVHVWIDHDEQWQRNSEGYCRGRPFPHHFQQKRRG